MTVSHISDMCNPVHHPDEKPISAYLREEAKRQVELLNSVARLEERSGLPKNTLKGLLAKEVRAPSVDRAKDIAEALGLEFYLGPPRDPVPNPPANTDDVTYIPRFDVAASAGIGAAHAEHEDPVGYLAFRAAWLRTQGIVASQAVLVDVRGDSMEPELHDGDIILVDTRQVPPRPGRTYVFRDIDDTIRVKRLASAHETAYFISLNDDYPTETRTGPEAERIHIIGRVAWFARTLE